MKKILAILLSVIVVSSFSSAYAEEPIILEQLSPSGQILVKLEWPEVYPHELNQFKVSFHDPTTGELLDEIRLNYNIEVSQHDHPVEVYTHNLATDGTGEFDVLFPEESQGLAKVVVELRASSHTSGEVRVYNEKVEFTVNVVLASSGANPCILQTDTNEVLLIGVANGVITIALSNTASTPGANPAAFTDNDDIELDSPTDTECMVTFVIDQFD